MVRLAIITACSRLFANRILLGIPIDLATYNAVLRVSLENEHPFDAEEALKVVEQDLQLKPDVHFFNHLLWRTARFAPKSGEDRTSVQMAEMK